MNLEKLLLNFSIAIRFNLLQICPSVLSFEFALLFIPSFNVLSVYFYVFMNLVDVFYCFNFAKYRSLAPLWVHVVEVFMCLRFNMVTMNKKTKYISYPYSRYALCPACGLPGNIKYL